MKREQVRELLVNVLTGSSHSLIDYLTVLAMNESGGNPSAVTGTHVGLFQFGVDEWTDWKKVSKTNEDRTDAISSSLAARWFIKRIIATLEKVGVVEDWTSEDWVALLTQSWNAGWTWSRGVPYVIRWARENNRPVPRTPEQVAALAPEVPDAGKFLSDIGRAKWHRSVAREFMTLSKSKVVTVMATSTKVKIAGAIVVAGLFAMILTGDKDE
jgi:hypothetical protein